ncbi:MAG: hypothetical protein WKF77_00465 [Planctomycetaceae bacterium]
MEYSEIALLRERLAGKRPLATDYRDGRGFCHEKDIGADLAELLGEPKVAQCRRYQHRNSPKRFRSSVLLQLHTQPKVDDLELSKPRTTDMLAAEKTSRELVDSLAYFGGVEASVIIWGFIDEFPRTFVYLDWPYEHARDAVEFSLTQHSGASLLADMRASVELNGLPRLLQKAVIADMAWKFAADAGLPLVGPPHAVEKCRCHYFAEIANPFRLFLRIITLGVVPVALPKPESPELVLMLLI